MPYPMVGTIAALVVGLALLVGNNCLAAVFDNQQGLGYSGAVNGKKLVGAILMSNGGTLPSGSTSPSGEQLAGGVLDAHGYIWMVPHSSRVVMRLNPATGTIMSFGNWPSGFSLPSSNAFVGGVYDGRRVWMMPCNADRVVTIDTVNFTMRGYNNWPSGFTKRNYAFAGGIFDGRRVFMVPQNADRVVSVDTVSLTMQGYNGWPSGYNSGTEDQFIGGIFDGRRMWMAPRNANRLVYVDTVTGVMTGLTNWPSGFSKGPYAFDGGVFDNARRRIWLIPRSADRVISVNVDTLIMTGHNNWPSGFSKGANAFSGAVFDGRKLWLIPFNADRVISIDASTFGMSSHRNWPSGFSKGNEAFHSAAYDGKDIYLIPWSADRVVRLSGNGVNSVSGTLSGLASATTSATKFGASASSSLTTSTTNVCTANESPSETASRSLTHTKTLSKSHLSSQSISSSSSNSSTTSSSSTMSVAATVSFSVTKRTASITPSTAGSPTQSTSVTSASASESVSLSHLYFPACDIGSCRIIAVDFLYCAKSYNSAKSESNSTGCTLLAPYLGLTQSGVMVSTPISMSAAVTPSTNFVFGISCSTRWHFSFASAFAAPQLTAVGADPRSLLYEEIANATSPVNGWYSVVVRLSLSRNDTAWVAVSNVHREAAVSVRFPVVQCGKQVGDAMLRIPVSPLLQPTVVEVAKVSTLTAQWISSFGSPSSAIALGRVAAGRRLMLCSASGISQGGLLGIRVDVSQQAVESGDDDNNAVLDRAFSRGAIVGNLVVVLVGGVLLLSAGVLFHQLTRCTLPQGFYRVALPSSLVSTWAMAVPGTVTSAAFLLVSGVNSTEVGALESSINAAVASVGIFVCLAPLLALSGIPLKLQRHFQLRLGRWNDTHELSKNCSQPSRRAGFRACVDRCEVVAAGWERLVHFYTYVVRRRALWSSQVAANMQDTQPLKPCQVHPVASSHCEVDPHRVAWVLLLEFRWLWYPVLDLSFLQVAGALSAVSGTGSTALCQASGVLILVMYLSQVLVQIRMQPYTSWFSLVYGVLCLALTCVSVAFQLVFVAVGGVTNAVLPPWWALYASTVCDLLVVGMSFGRIIAVDIPQFVRALRAFINDMITHREREARTVALVLHNSIELISINENVNEVCSTLLASDLCVEGGSCLGEEPATPLHLKDSGNEFESMFWNSSGRAKSAFHSSTSSTADDVVTSSVIATQPIRDNVYDADNV